MADNDSIQLYPWFPKTDPPLAGGSKSGEWQSREQQKLTTLAENLVYEVASSRVNSLPSPWSRALQFRQAVDNPKYPTRDDLLKELFGCFASVGLCEIMGLKLTADPLKLKDAVSVQDEAVGSFARSLQGSKPGGDKTLYTLANGSNPWDEIYILRIDDGVIGFTSPATLLCPAVHMLHQIPGMKWTTAGRFTPPNNYLNNQQKQTLAEWLIYVSNGLLIAPDSKDQILSSKLAEVLEEFAQSLTPTSIGKAILSSEKAIGLPQRPTAISLLSRAAKGNENITSQTNVKLEDRRKFPLPESPRLPIVLIDNDMPSWLGLPPSEIVLHKSATLESTGGVKDRLLSQYRSEIEVITPDDIFTSELYLLPGQSVIQNSWISRKLEGTPQVNGIPVTPILPFKEQIRNLFSSSELERMCTLRLVTTASGSDLKITLQIPLDEHQEAYPITRSFAIKESNLIDSELPVIAIWPFINEHSWKHYVIFSDDQTGIKIDGFRDYNLSIVGDEEKTVKYHRTERFPDAIKLCDRTKYLGILSITQPPTSRDTSSFWRVGIDFGTSFTNFFIDEGSGPIRMALEPKVATILVAEEEYKLNLLYKYFMPVSLLPRNSNPPTSTALNTFGWQEARGVVPELFHQARVQWPSANAEAMRGKFIRTGFKWKQPQYQRPFLKHLALLISCNAAASGASSIDWSISYPSAFSPNESRNYLSVWESLCSELTLTTGIIHQIEKHSNGNELQTEAIAFAGYFGNYKSLRLVHTACLDVGGGTTDFSIWQDNSLLHQVSIPFAGRDICTKILQRKPSFIRFLFTPQLAGEVSESEAKLRQDPNFNSWLDTCLRYESDDLLHERLPIYRSEKNQQLLSFVSIMSIGFAGLYHYLGIVLKSLVNESRSEKRLRKQAPMPVYIGGNGARFLHWLDESGSFGRGCDADRLMEALQAKSAGFTASKSVSAPTTLSNEFKDETACGLISTGINLTGTFDPRDEAMIAGEEMEINGILFKSLDRVSLPSTISAIETFSLTSLDELRHFVDCYDEVIRELRITSLLPVYELVNVDYLWDLVETEVRAITLERIGKKVSDLEPEPGFIIALRALGNVLAHEWSQRF